MNLACWSSSRGFAQAKFLHPASFATNPTRALSTTPFSAFALSRSRHPQPSSRGALRLAPSARSRATIRFSTGFPPPSRSAFSQQARAFHVSQNVSSSRVSARMGTTFNDLSSLQASLAHLHLLRFQNALWAPMDSGEVWVFRDGAIVCWNLDDEKIEALTKATVEETISALVRSSTPSDEESFAPATYSLLPVVERAEVQYRIDPLRSTSIDDDQIVLGSLDAPNPSAHFTRIPQSTPIPPPSSLAQSQTFLARYAFSSALAHHLALSAFERSIDSHYQRMQSYFRYRAMMHPELQRRKGEGDLRLVEPAAELLHMRRHFAYGVGAIVDVEGMANAKEFMGEVKGTFGETDESTRELVDMLSRHLGVPEQIDRLERKLAQSTDEAMLLAAAGVGPAPDRFVAPWRIVLIYAALCVGFYYYEYGPSIANDSTSMSGGSSIGEDDGREAGWSSYGGE